VKRLLLVLAACSSGSKPHEPPATAVEKSAAPDPWAVESKPSTGTKNLNKLVIGGDNTKPQMGLFALTTDAAKQVDAAMQDGLEPAYRLAQKLATKAWAGDRNFCADAVRMTIGYLGIDGMLEAADLRKWKTAKLADVRKQHIAEINKLHVEMIGEQDEAGCDQVLAQYVEGLQLAANDKLELRNFGY
jgi:hypothetical protein